MLNVAYSNGIVCVTLPTVREKAKQLVSLLKDEERLKDERRRGQQARARHAAISSNAEDTPPANKKK